MQNYFNNFFEMNKLRLGRPKTDEGASCTTRSETKQSCETFVLVREKCEISCGRNDNGSQQRAACNTNSFTDLGCQL